MDIYTDSSLYFGYKIYSCYRCHYNCKTTMGIKGKDNSRQYAEKSAMENFWVFLQISHHPQYWGWRDSCNITQSSSKGNGEWNIKTLFLSVNLLASLEVMQYSGKKGLYVVYSHLNAVDIYPTRNFNNESCESNFVLTHQWFLLSVCEDNSQRFPVSK